MVHSWRGATDVQWLETKDAAKDETLHRTAPMTVAWSDGSSAKVGRHFIHPLNMPLCEKNSMNFQVALGKYKQSQSNTVHVHLLAEINTPN